MAFVVNKATYLFLCFESTKIESPLLIKLHAHAIQVKATDTKHHRLNLLHDRKNCVVILENVRHSTGDNVPRCS